MYVIGAGLSGCIAGVLNPDATIIEAGARRVAHAAVLRFRGPQIGQALGIPFREVRVLKSVYMDHQHHQWATPAMMNWYAQKVTKGRISERSIGDLSPVQRWVAPDNFHEQMLARIEDRIQFDTPVRSITREEIVADSNPYFHSWARKDVPVISTMPLPQLAKILGVTVDAQFAFEPIIVRRWTLPDCNVNQTVYFPSPDINLYRATLTGNTLIAESMTEDDVEEDARHILSDAFGVPQALLADKGKVKQQQYGKIQPIDTELRKRTLWQFTSQFGVFSLGRFALWSNILLDDVFDDLAKIRQMINLMNNGYDLLRSHT